MKNILVLLIAATAVADVVIPDRYEGYWVAWSEGEKLHRKACRSVGFEPRLCEGEEWWKADLSDLLKVDELTTIIRESERLDRRKEESEYYRSTEINQRKCLKQRLSDWLDVGRLPDR